jgi:rhodanese-related sulfurtransferase
MSSRPRFIHTISKSVLLILIGSLIGILNNSFSPGGIALVGSWSKRIISDSLIVPGSYDAQDPPAISLSEAERSFQTKKVLFVDARLSEDFNSGHIAKAINLPYEDFEGNFPEVGKSLSSASELIIYCDGIECESGLFLARLLKDKGFQNIKVFFGGWKEWVQAGLPMEKG